MAFSDGFFNAKEKDRQYTAENFNDYLSSIICNGILDTYGDMFELTAPETGLRVILGSGKAWINGHYFLNDSKYSIDLSSYLDESLPRYVAIAIVCDTSDTVRKVQLEVIPGTPAENPDVPQIPLNENRTRLLLYAVRLNVGAVSLSDFDWFDYRDDDNLCGYCKCILGKCKLAELQALQQEVANLEIKKLEESDAFFPYLYPNVSGDTLNATDASYLLQFSAGCAVGTYSNDSAGWKKFAEENGLNENIFPDADGDGSIKATDAPLILDFCAKIGTGSYANNKTGWNIYMLRKALSDLQGGFQRVSTELAALKQQFVPIVTLTQEAYDALEEIDENTLYVIT